MNIVVNNRTPKENIMLRNLPTESTFLRFNEFENRYDLYIKFESDNYGNDPTPCVNLRTHKETFIYGYELVEPIKHKLII